MNKFEYIVRNLSRTKRKDYENYVINKIYSELNDFEIKPVTQQYVRRGDGKYALIDLYFPQLNIGIECDEFYHHNNIEEDKLRFTDIVNAISSYEEIRIAIFHNSNKIVHRTLEDINADISDAVKRIKEKKLEKKDFIPWDGKPDIVRVLEKGEFNTKDNYIFTQKELRSFFGREGWTQSAYYKINNDYYIWLPGLAVEDKGKFIAYNKNLEYINIISQDGEKIEEFLPNIKKMKEESSKRIVFVKIKDFILNKQVYKFAGIFERDNKIIEKYVNGEKKYFVIHKKVANRIIKKSDNNYLIEN